VKPEDDPDFKAAILPALAKKVEIFDAAAKAMEDVVNAHGDKAERAILVSALAHIIAEIIAKNTCCVFHAMEIWGEIGMAVIAGAMPGDKIEWEPVIQQEDDDSWVPPPIKKTDKLH